MEENDVVRSLLALAQPVRLQVFRRLVVAGANGLTPGALAQALQVPATSLSFHLKELANSGLVTQQRQGRFLIYRANFSRVGGLLAYLTENCCQGQACEAPSPRADGKAAQVAADTAATRVRSPSTRT